MSTYTYVYMYVYMYVYVHVEQIVRNICSYFIWFFKC